MTTITPDPFTLAMAAFTPSSEDHERAETIRRMTARWQAEARPNQLPPPGDWFVLLYLAGAGWGKTRTGAEWAASKGREFKGCRVALIAPTFADGRDIMVEGESGLLTCFADIELRGGSRDTAWNRSLGELYLANGSRYKVYSSEKPRQLRGPQHHFAWGDEPAEWADAHLGARATPETDTTWSNLTMRLRLPARPHWPSHYRPQVVLTGTPKRKMLLKSRDEDNPGLLQQERIVVVRGRTDENLGNLSEDYVRRQIDPLRGTRLGRQELDAELLEDVEGALWTFDEAEARKLGLGLIRHVPALPESDELGRRVLAVDPSDGEQDSDEYGLAVVIAHTSGALYVPFSDGVKLGPEGNVAHTAKVYADWECDVVVVEKNHGGGYLPAMLRREGLPVQVVTASQGKRTRAEPVAAEYAISRPGVFHVGALDVLETQLTSFTGDAGQDSPDRLDALVWGVAAHLTQQRRRRAGFRQFAA